MSWGESSLGCKVSKLVLSSEHQAKYCRVELSWSLWFFLLWPVPSIWHASPSSVSEMLWDKNTVSPAEKDASLIVVPGHLLSPLSLSDSWPQA